MKKRFFAIILGGVIAIIIALIWNWDFSRANRPMVFGVTFSTPQAKYLGLDWQATYLDMLDNLKVKNLRLLAYWNQVEETPDQFDFTDLDWQVAEAAKRGAKIIMTVGRRLPHWPECHSPEWTKDLSEKENQAEILTMLRAVVEHYKGQPSIVMWQVDNEPLVNWFGSCPEPDRDFVKKEIALVKSLDSRPVLITDSGELSSWVGAARLGDYFGTTMYRVVWNKYIGYWSYDWFLPPAFYTVKAKLNGLDLSKVIVAELQTEAWLRDDISQISLEEQKKSINPEQFRKNIGVARRTGFSEAYLWGVEYWYWLKQNHGDSSLYDEAKNLWH